MKTLSIDVRRAEPHDARAISEAHRLSWQQAYAGLIPHRPLTQMLERRGEIWWKKATRGSATMLVVEVRGLPHDGEIYELYLRPEYQGIGLGSLLFTEARRLLTSLGCNGIVVWCLEDSDVANRFFRSHGGRDIAEGMEDFGGKSLRKVGFVWN
jgi:GNAT superfamily N-acetyltransferase